MKVRNSDVTECGRTCKVNRFGVSFLKSLGLAKHSRNFETSGLVSGQGLDQEAFKSLNRISIETQEFSQKYPQVTTH